MTDPEGDEPLTVGARLRLAREEMGLSLHQVADVLRLKASQVYALEMGDYDALPGQTFVTGFLRSYANLLNLDAVAIVELYKNEAGGGLRAPSLAFPEPTTGGRMPGTGILLGTFVVALILLAGWFLYQESESFDFERVAELPEHLAGKILEEDTGSERPAATSSEGSVTAPNNVVGITPATPQAGTSDDPAGETAASEPETAPLASSAAETAESAVADNVPASESEEETTGSVSGAETDATSATPEATSPSVTAEAAPAASATAEEAESASDAGTGAAAAGATAGYPQDTLNTASAAQPASEETPANPLSRTFGVENTDARVVLRATEESWVEVRVGNQRPVLSRVLNPGDVYMVPNDPDLKMTTGNAGGLEILVDGQEIRSLGGTGKIVRDISLAANSLIENIGLQ